MDIAYLLALQNFRNGCGAIFTGFMLKMTLFGELNTMMVIISIIYWCISKEAGAFMLMGWSGNRLVNSLIKLTACVYRPWMRDPRIVPYGNSTRTALGYSFPSGHTMNAAALFGPVTLNRRFSPAMRTLAFICILLVGLSRNFIGVHTPQDIIVGAALGLLVVYLASRLMDHVKENPEKDIKVACIGVAFAIIAAVYVLVKPYPTRCDEAGKLLIDGRLLCNDGINGVGYFTAFLIGWVLERRLVRFSTDVSLYVKAERLIAGLLGYYAISTILVPLMRKLLPLTVSTFFSSFGQMFYIVFLFPLLMVHFKDR